MRDLTRALEGLCDDLAMIQREITILEQIGRALAELSNRFDGGADLLVRRHLDEIGQRTAAALARQASIARTMEECGRERRGARPARPYPVRRIARRMPWFPRPIAGRTKSP